MRTGLQDAEWDGIWAEYDQHLPQAPAAPQARAPEPVHNQKAKTWPLLALVLLVLPMPHLAHRKDAHLHDTRREAPLSLSPIEAELPPVSVSIARLASESAASTCWVLVLRPQGGGCEAGGAAR